MSSLNDDLPRVTKQVDIFTAFDARQNEQKSVAVGTIERTEPEGEVIFPQYETPTVELKKQKQPEISLPDANETPGLKAFNVAHLLDSKMFDIAEYFLGRKLTDEEKLTGLVNYEENKKDKEDKRASTRDQEVLESLARLVSLANKHDDEYEKRKAAAPMPPMRAGAEHKDDDDDDDDEDKQLNISKASQDRDQADRDLDESLHQLDYSTLRGRELDEEIQHTLAGLHESLRDIPEAEEEQEVRTAADTEAAPTVKRQGDQINYNPDQRYPGPQIDNLIKAFRARNQDLETEWKKAYHGRLRSKEAQENRPSLFKAVPSSVNDKNAFLKRALSEIAQQRREMENVLGELSHGARSDDEAEEKERQEAAIDLARRSVPGGHDYRHTYRPGLVADEEEEPASKPLRAVARGFQKKREYKKRELVPFGPKWLVDPLALKEGNELIIVRQTDRGHINKHPNRIVSPAVKVCLGEQLEGKKMSTDLLTPDEKEWMQWLLEDGKMAFKQKPATPLEIKRTPKQMRDRLSILFGEISEGPNDNPEVKREFKSLFNQACMNGILKQEQVKIGQDLIATF